jgi:hypothetical protein
MYVYFNRGTHTQKYNQRINCELDIGVYEGI